MLHGRQERGMEKDMIAREIKVATKKSHIWEFIYTNVNAGREIRFFLRQRPIYQTFNQPRLCVLCPS